MVSVHGSLQPLDIVLEPLVTDTQFHNVTLYIDKYITQRSYPTHAQELRYYCEPTRWLMCLYTVLWLLWQLLPTVRLSNLSPRTSRPYLESHCRWEKRVDLAVETNSACTCKLTALEDMYSSLVGMSGLGLCLDLERGETSSRSHATPVQK